MKIIHTSEPSVSVFSTTKTPSPHFYRLPPPQHSFITAVLMCRTNIVSPKLFVPHFAPTFLKMKQSGLWNWWRFLSTWAQMQINKCSTGPNVPEQVWAGAEQWWSLWYCKAVGVLHQLFALKNCVHHLS